MDFGVCTHSFRNLCRPEAAAALDWPCPGTFEGLIDLAARYGLSIAESPLRADASFAEAARLRERAEAVGVRLVMDSGRAAESPLEALIPLASALGSRSLRLTLSGILEGDRRAIGRAGWEEICDTAARRLRQARPLAEAHDVALAIENHQDADSDDLLRLCDTVGGDHVGVNLDTGNPLAVGEGPVEFAERIAPVLKNVHLKDYRMHRTASGYRLVRCALGDGVVDFPALFRLFAAAAPSATCSIELGATQARHIRVFEDSFWEHYSPRPLSRFLPALRLMQSQALPESEEWRTPHERDAPEAERCAYERGEFERSVAYLDQALGRSGVQAGEDSLTRSEHLNA
jgi:3-oxoisoapionate decarboxylase